MIVEMHCHTSNHSACSHVPAVDLVRRAHQTGIQTIVITDHHYLWTAQELTELKHRSGLPEVCCILAGQEVGTRDFGHVLVYGAAESIPKDTYTVREIRAQYPDAAIIWAHPYRDGKIPEPERLLDPLLNGIEIFSSNYAISDALQALEDWHKYKFTAISGTDTHAYSYTGTYPTIFDHPVDSIQALADELKAGRCRPYFKEIPHTGTTRTAVKEVTVGPKTAGERKKMIVKTFEDVDAWHGGQRTHHIVEQLYQYGFDRGPYRVPKPLGENPRTRSVAEERIKGPSLYDAVVEADADRAVEYLRRAALWLAKLHNARLELTPTDEFLTVEPDRLQYYIKPFIENRHRHLHRIRQIHDQVLQLETQLIRSHPELLVQSHGDYHPKNIFINSEPSDDGEFIAVIDFGSSYQAPRALDVGTFIAQTINMFFNDRHVQQLAPGERFLQIYRDQAAHLEEDFLDHVNLYKARTCLSILYYLNKVGMNDSENFWRILVEAERSLTAIRVKNFG